MKIQGATVLVTGSNRGLGRALVQAVLAAGARRVYATARQPKQLADLHEAAPDRVVVLPLDVTDTSSITRAVSSAPDVTLLFNNAGALSSQHVLTSDPSLVAEEFAINCFGMLETTKAFTPALERAGESAIVNILSIVSLASMPAIGGYAASKAAAYSITQGLRGELAPRGVRVHGVFPGPIDTDMVRDMNMPKTSPSDVARAILDGVDAGVSDIFPDAASREMVALWKKDPEALAAQLRSM